MSPVTVVAAPPRERLEFVDRLRGLVMVLMALDHVRDILQSGETLQIMTDLSRTTAPLFLTRWVTHLCAPTFIFLAGAGIFLGRAAGKTRAQMTWFLVSRGLWLALLEITWVHLSWFMDNSFHDIPASILWAIGWSMVGMAVLIWLPTPLVAVVATAIIVGHNLTDSWKLEELGGWSWLCQLVEFGPRGPGFQLPIPPAQFDQPAAWSIAKIVPKSPPADQIILFPIYAIGPWLGVMAAGYVIAEVFLLERAMRQRLLLSLGLAAIVVFLIARWNNGYGDPDPWRPQEMQLLTVFSFINTTKYPPSLCFVLMTLGPALLLLALFDRSWGIIGRILSTYGRVPLFYYLIHLMLIQLVGLGIFWIQQKRGIYESLADVKTSAGLDLSLGASYLTWLVVLVILYFPCLWFGRLKRRSRNVILSYL